MARHNTHTVTLPAAASQAAHAVVDDQFDFSTTNANGPPTTVPPPPLEDLPGQTADHVPENAGPQGLPIEASVTAADQLDMHVPWLDM